MISQTKLSYHTASSSHTSHDIGGCITTVISQLWYYNCGITVWYNRPYCDIPPKTMISKSLRLDQKIQMDSDSSLPGVQACLWVTMTHQQWLEGLGLSLSLRLGAAFLLAGFKFHDSDSEQSPWLSVTHWACLCSKASITNEMQETESVYKIHSIVKKKNLQHVGRVSSGQQEKVHR
jgi:hypothetical protein